MACFIHKPTINLIARTIIDPDDMERWAMENGLVNVLDDNDTPLGKMHLDLCNDGNASVDMLTEFGGRHCYRAWEKGRERGDYVANILESRHGSVLRHSHLSFAISGVSRSFTHELVRHAAGCAPSQESQRYVAANDINFVVPPLVLALHEAASTVEEQDGDFLKDFEEQCLRDLNDYRVWQSRLLRQLERKRYVGQYKTLNQKRVNEAARSRLPNAAETRLLWTMNMQATRFVLEQRGSEFADLEIRRWACAMYRVVKEVAPLTFVDFSCYTAEDGFEALRCVHSKV